MFFTDFYQFFILFLSIFIFICQFFRWVKRNNWSSPKLVKRKRIVKRKIYLNSSCVKSEIYCNNYFSVRADCIQAGFANTFSWIHGVQCENCNKQISQTKRFCQHLSKGNKMYRIHFNMVHLQYNTRLLIFG